VGPLRILLADDHALVRAGIRALLESIKGVEVIGEASEGLEALRMIGEHHPDLALVDISMPGLNGLEVTARAVKECPRTRVILLSMHADDEYVYRALRAGAAGYLVKNADRRELEMAVHAVARNEVWLSPAVSKKVVAALSTGKHLEDPAESLTPRQREILQLVAEGFSSKEIAHRLGLGLRTVESHRAELMDRLGIRDLTGLVRYAIRLGIVRVER
jgi:DNA-binding NarL/FixJ family response regulator